MRSTDWTFICNSLPTSLTFNNSAFCSRYVCMFFVWLWEQTAIISVYSIDRLVFIAETECVYCAVRTGSLNMIPVNVSLARLQCQSALLSATEPQLLERWKSSSYQLRFLRFWQNILCIFRLVESWSAAVTGWSGPFSRLTLTLGTFRTAKCWYEWSGEMNWI